MTDTIRYREIDAYKYQLAEPYRILTPLHPDVECTAPYLRLDEKGWLTMSEGLEWDGASGPAIDTKNFLRGSLVHDALYRLMREGKLDPKVARPIADRMLVSICREDGMSWIRARWVGWAVRHFASRAADKDTRPEPDERVLEAP